jgi:hypothetical protein
MGRRRFSPILRRRPSKVDVLLEEESRCAGFERGALELMEPRPVGVAGSPVTVNGLGMGFAGFAFEERSYVGGHMGGIFEVMEGEA